MSITLHPDQEVWLQRRVESGDFASVEAAARQLLGERIAELAAQGEDETALDDRAWAKPYIDEGLATLDRGKFLTLEEHKAPIASLLVPLPPKCRDRKGMLAPRVERPRFRLGGP